MKKIISIVAISTLFLASCEDPLNEVIYSQLAPNTLLNTENGINSVLNSAYAFAHRNDGGAANWSPYYLGASPSGEVYGKGGSIEALWVQLENFTWNPIQSQITSQWPIYYNAIRDANIVLENIDESGLSSTFISSKKAEAHFIRAWAYSELYNLFGALPIYQSTLDDPLQPRATEEATKAFIESELSSAIADLPETSQFGKGNKGAARAIAAKYYLNTKQWQNAQEMCDAVIGMGKYGLESSVERIYAMDNEGNKEMVWALPKTSLSGTNGAIQALIYPPTYPRPYSNNGVFAARTYLYDSFVNSFEVSDARKGLITTAWSVGGISQPALGKNQSFPSKYPWDPNSQGWMTGNDVPIVRYADILISKAEAMNELNGPSQAAVDLINQVRLRANASQISLVGLTKESFRTLIFKERSWEFFFEGKNREDQIRQGTFISDAVSRGKAAKDFHKLYPIPQTEIDANKNLTQNPGY